jgi:hypothetical protein
MGQNGAGDAEFTEENVKKIKLIEPSDRATEK